MYRENLQICESKDCIIYLADGTIATGDMHRAGKLFQCQLTWHWAFVPKKKFDIDTTISQAMAPMLKHIQTYLKNGCFLLNGTSKLDIVDFQIGAAL